MSLLFNMLSRFVLAFLPRSRHLLISWLQSPCAMVLGPKKVKICYCFHFFPFYLPWSDGTRCHDLSFLDIELQASYFTHLFVAFRIHLISNVVLLMLIASCFHSPVMAQPFLFLPFYTSDVEVYLFLCVFSFVSVSLVSTILFQELLVAFPVRQVLCVWESLYFSFIAEGQLCWIKYSWPAIFIFHTLTMSFHFVLACRISAGKSTDSLATIRL